MAAQTLHARVPEFGTANLGQEPDDASGLDTGVPNPATPLHKTPSFGTRATVCPGEHLVRHLMYGTCGRTV
jgi:hypothetical protein